MDTHFTALTIVFWKGSNCHESAELTDASVRRVQSAINGPVRNRDGNLIDKGFNNVGIRPTSDDLGVGASDAFGPLSHTRRRFPGAAPWIFCRSPTVGRRRGRLRPRPGFRCSR